MTDRECPAEFKRSIRLSITTTSERLPVDALPIPFEVPVRSHPSYVAAPNILSKVLLNSCSTIKSAPTHIRPLRVAY